MERTCSNTTFNVKGKESKMKAVIPIEEAKQKLLELYQANNPDITEIHIEGMLGIDEVNKLLTEAKEDATVKVSKIPKPASMPDVSVTIPGDPPIRDKPQDVLDYSDLPSSDDPEMVTLARSLQTVIDDGRMYTIRWHKGPNAGTSLELTKGLETRCDHCPYIASSEKDVDNHADVYHKEHIKRKKEYDAKQLQLSQAAAAARRKDLDAGKKKGWKAE